MPAERLQKFLAGAGIDSRRHSEELITAGRVSVNGKTVTALGSKVDPQCDLVEVDGRSVTLPPAHRYLLLNKPPGYLTTASDDRGRPTVVELLPQDGLRVFPVGRLDMESEGLLLLTSDGVLTHRLTHPRYGVEREYLAVLSGSPTPEGLARLRAGAEVSGRAVAPLRLTLATQPTGSADLRDPDFRVRLVVGEGRKREVREIARAAGYQVRRLVRVRYGPLRLGRLRSGAVRPLHRNEVSALRKAVGLVVQAF